MKTLLIGGAGFIGHHLALALDEPVIIDSLAVNNMLSLQEHSPRNQTFLQERMALLQAKGVPLLIQDARCYDAISRLIGKIKPDAIIHLAAVAHADTSQKDPYSTFDHSLRTLENALDAARAVGIGRFVYISSSMVYGDFECGVAAESSPLKPKGVYGALKAAGELMVRSYSETFGLPHTIVRPSALYGERCVSGRVIQKFIEAALDGREVTASAEQLDFTYIGDLVAGLRLVLENPQAENRTFNITFGTGRTVAEAAEIVKQHMPGFRYTLKAREDWRPARGTLSVAGLKALGYKPEWPIERGIKQYMEWYQSC